MKTQIHFNHFYMRRLMDYSSVYDISFQMWPNQYTVYIAKHGIDLTSFGLDNPDEVMLLSLQYLDRINKQKV